MNSKNTTKVNLKLLSVTKTLKILIENHKVRLKKIIYILKLFIIRLQTSAIFFPLFKTKCIFRRMTEILINLGNRFVKKFRLSCDG